MRAILDLFVVVLDMYSYVLIAAIISSWLVSFNIINVRSPFVGQVLDILYRLTEPVLAPIRNRLPQMGGLDLSPIIVFLGIYFIKSVIYRYIYPNVF
jgi:YggT family protein